jgi:hypothetical protein
MCSNTYCFVVKKMSTNRIRFPLTRGVEFGAAGGLAGALVMGAIAYMMPINGQPFFIAAAMSMIGLAGTTAIAAGWMMHLITGLIVGVLFGAIVSQVRQVRVSGIGRGFGLGALAGIVVWLVFFMPLMISMLSKMGMSPSALMVGGSFAAHLIFGLILGGVVGATVPKYVSASIPAVNRPSPSSHPTETRASGSPSHQFQCRACGTNFNSEKELMDHAKEAHPMPAN